MRDVRGAVRERDRGQRGAHPAHLRVPLRALVDGAVGLEDRIGQRLRQPVGRHTVDAVVERLHRLDGEFARDVAGVVPAEPVGDREHHGAREELVFVAVVRAAERSAGLTVAPPARSSRS